VSFNSLRDPYVAKDKNPEKFKYTLPLGLPRALMELKEEYDKVTYKVLIVLKPLIKLVIKDSILYNSL